MKIDDMSTQTKETIAGSTGSTPVEKQQGWSYVILDWIKTFIVAIVFVALINTFLFNLSTVKGESMQPTLQESDRIFINKIAYRIGEPKLGDVVILKDPSADVEHKDLLVKRVVGLPGDKIEIKEYRLYRNDRLIVEPYTNTLIEEQDFDTIIVGDDEYFVMGDNRHFGKSKDSRRFGAVSRDDLVGRADFIFWPFSGIRKL